MVLYIGTTTDVPLIPWNKEKRAFHVAPLSSEYEKRVVRHFDKLDVNYLGSDNGCGCGFRREEDVLVSDFQKQAEEKQVNHDALGRYLEKLPPQDRPIKIYACWSGDEGQPVSTSRQISIAEISKPEFFFREREMLTIV